jgi:hypothetical protein
MVGHHDCQGLRAAASKSWNASHPSRSMGGHGLVYCFAVN